MATSQDAYRFRIVGEGFNGSTDHVRWVPSDDGQWYRARWIDYDFQSEHLVYPKFNGDLAELDLGAYGYNVWKPVSVNEIYDIAYNNPRLTLYLPDVCGPV